MAGIRVVDFTIVMSGPLCTRMLADLGADVIKVETPQGDSVRQRPPMRGSSSTYFASLNCGKRSVVLDLKSPEGLEAARLLCLEADIVVENFRPGVMKRFGLDYESLSPQRPRLIYASLSGFGQSGPFAGRPAYAPVIHASSGYDSAHMEQQEDAQHPANNGIFVADVLGGIHAASAIHLALYDRERTGLGQHIDLALMDGVLGMLVYELQLAQFPRDVPRLLYRPVRAKDGFVMVAPVSRKNLAALSAVIGDPDVDLEAKFGRVRQREDNWKDLLAVISKWTAERTAAECEEILMAAGVPCARYRSVTEVLDDPQLAARGTFQRLGEKDDTFLVTNLPYRLSRARTQARSLLATLGQHTREVLRDVLGYSPERAESTAKARSQSRAPLEGGA